MSGVESRSVDLTVPARGLARRKRRNVLSRPDHAAGVAIWRRTVMGGRIPGANSGAGSHAEKPGNVARDEAGAPQRPTLRVDHIGVRRHTVGLLGSILSAGIRASRRAAVPHGAGPRIALTEVASAPVGAPPRGRPGPQPVDGDSPSAPSLVWSRESVCCGRSRWRS